jgi:hypothetical protein
MAAEMECLKLLQLATIRPYVLELELNSSIPLVRVGFEFAMGLGGQVTAAVKGV